MPQDKVLPTRRHRNWNNFHLPSHTLCQEGDEVDYPLGGVQMTQRRVIIDSPPVTIAASGGDRSGAVSFSPDLGSQVTRGPEEASETFPNFTKLDVFIGVYSIISYVLDVGSDIWLALHYYRQGQTAWFVMTITPPIIASLIMTILSLIWYHTDTENGLEVPIPRWRWFLRILFHVLQLGPLIRYVDTMCYGFKSKRRSLDHHERKKFTILRLYEDADAAMLRMIECFFEAAPQLILQLYIIITQSHSHEYTKLVIQYGSCVLSWTSLAWSFVSYQAALRSARRDKNTLSWAGIFFFYMWRLLVLGPRILAFSLFVSVYREWIFVLLTFHVLIMFAWVVLQRTSFCEGACRQVKEVLWNLIVAVMYCFDFLNVKEGRTRLKFFIYYSIHYLENVVLVLLWHFRAAAGERTCCRWNHWMLLGLVLGLFWVGLLFMFIYYRFFHPSGHIPCCLSCPPSWSQRGWVIGEASGGRARGGRGPRALGVEGGPQHREQRGTSSSSSNPVHVGTSSSHSRSVSSPSADPTEGTVSPEFMSCHNGQYLDHHQSFV